MNKIIKNRIIYNCYSNDKSKITSNIKSTSTKSTIKNLNNVLGVEEIIPKPLKLDLSNNEKTKVVLVVKPEFDYFKFAELINGRCASLGILLGKVEYMISDNNMYTQLTTEIDTNVFYLLFNFSIISCISLLSFHELKEDDFVMDVEDFFHKFSMLIWLVNIPIVLYYYLCD